MSKKKLQSTEGYPSEPCPQCRERGEDRSGNNLITFPDGKKWCFNCNDKSLVGAGFVQGDIWPLEASRGWLARGIKEETCRKADFRMGKYTGKLKTSDGYRQAKDEWVQIATWRDPKTNKIIAQKIRAEDKAFKFIGNGKNLDLWGIHDYTPTDKLFIVITGGEIDRLSVMQAQGLQYPVVSPPAGEGSAYKAIQKNLDILLQYKYVVLALDNDDAGRRAMLKAAELFDVDKVKLVKWPSKDPNELTQERREDEIVKAIWDAKVIEPDHLVTVSDIIDQVMEKPEFGTPYPWPSLTALTYGRHPNTIFLWGAAPGIGKTEIIKDLNAQALEYNNILVMSFEQTPADTVRRYVGAKLHLKLQKPGERWPEDDIRKAALDYDNRIWLYDFDGHIEVDDICRCINFAARAKNCKTVIIDNLKSLKIVMNKEACQDFATELRGLAKKLGLEIHLVSHVNKSVIRQSTHVGFSSLMPEGKKPHEDLSEEQIKATMNKFSLDWENGRIPTASELEGGNDFEAIADYVFLLGRNKQSPNERVRRTIIVRPSKYGRIDDEYSKREFKLYRNDEGILEEVEDGLYDMYKKQLPDEDIY